MKRKVLAAAAALAFLLALTACAGGGTPESGERVDDVQPSIAADETALFERFRGTWVNEEDPQFILELKDGVEIIGIDHSEQLSEAEFEIVEANEDDRAIVVRGMRRDLQESGEAEPYESKLQLAEDGESLIYLFDHLNEKVESRWQKKEDQP
ncbi:hypothetical protein ACF3MZ_10215 [Paenibacillaceae bacterium WGS1546]|uniref:hypothetical protein n=1 Tax=Cohnella sp. WGS1546 TaxID=3366810 RepID=UPI00372D32A5